MQRSFLSRAPSESSKGSFFGRWRIGLQTSPSVAYGATLAALFAIVMVQTEPLSGGITLLAALLLLWLLLVRERRSFGLAWLAGGCLVFCILALLRPELAPLLVVFVYVFASRGAPLIALLPGSLVLALTGAPSFALPVLALLLGLLLYLWRRQSKELVEQVDALRQELYRSEQKALTLLSDQRDVQRLSQLEERRNVAEKLHDNLGHELTAAHLSVKSVGALLKMGDIERAISAQRKGEERLTEALRQLKGAVSRLDPDDEADISPVTALFDRFVYPIELSIIGTSYGVEPYQVQLMHSAVKEALTNVAKHAVPRFVRATIEFTERIARITVTNDGTSDDSECPPGNGLRYLRKRLEVVRGSLSTTATGDEFTIIVTVPKGRP